jgi:hypothetical protein
MDEETGMISIGGALIGNTTDTVGTNMGTETIETKYGSLSLQHYVLTEDDFTLEQWAGEDNGIPYKMVYLYSTGLYVTLTLSETNMDA